MVKGRVHLPSLLSGSGLEAGQEIKNTGCFLGGKDPVVPMRFIYITKTNSMFATISDDPKAGLDARLSCTSTQQNKLPLASGAGREGDLLSTEQHLCFHNFLPIGLF